MHKTMQTDDGKRGSPFRNTALRNIEQLPKTRGSPSNDLTTDEYGFTMTGGANSSSVAHLGRQTLGAFRTQTGSGFYSTQNLMDGNADKVRSHVSSLIQADRNHDKNQKLFLFLKRQARKQASRNASTKDAKYEPR